jgi:hypothetical protein
MKCNLCKKWELDIRYAIYKDSVGNPYCRECYGIIGGQV